MMCPPPDPTFPSLHKIDCVLNQCKECKQYDVPEQEARLTDNDPHIRFHWYDTLPSCTIHGMLPKYPPPVEGQRKVQTKTFPYCDTEEAQAQAAGEEYHQGTFHKRTYLTKQKKKRFQCFLISIISQH